METRRRFKQTISLQARLSGFAEDARSKASGLPAGPGRDELLKKAALADTASHINEWVNSRGLQPPT